jgi:hypothetical protein
MSLQETLTLLLKLVTRASTNQKQKYLMNVFNTEIRGSCVMLQSEDRQCNPFRDAHDISRLEALTFLKRNVFRYLSRVGAN